MIAYLPRSGENVQAMLAVELSEFSTTAVLLAIFGALMLTSVLSSRTFQKLGLPVALLFLGVGMLGGSEGIFGIAFDDYRFAFRAGTVALVLILFDGGLNTSIRSIRKGFLPSLVMATIGVAITAVIVALFSRWLGQTWQSSWLLGAIVSSTDAATVFAVLRGSGLNLKSPVSEILELESGLNDPMAVILTVMVTSAVTGASAISAGKLWEVPIELLVGLAVGTAFGLLSARMLTRVRLSAAGLYFVLTLSIALFTYGIAAIVHGSGFLAVYACGIAIGNANLPFQKAMRRMHGAIGWLSQVSMFLMLGLLIYPSRLPAVAVIGASLAIVLAFVARPLATIVSLAPFRLPPREIGYLGWVGLRGAVPIILATYPVLSHAPAAEHVFNIVFFIVVINALIPGATVGPVTRWLKLARPDRPRPAAVLEMNSLRSLTGEVQTFFIEPALAVCGAALRDIEFPSKAAAILVVRGSEILAARGSTILNEGDHVYIFSRREDRPVIELLFGAPEA